MLGFFREYLANHHDTGAIAPSSRFLARTIVREAGVRPGVSVLELGPGTGAFTGAVEAAMGGEGRYLGIEINPRFPSSLPLTVRAGANLPAMLVDGDYAPRRIRDKLGMLRELDSKAYFYE